MLLSYVVPIATPLFDQSHRGSANTAWQMISGWVDGPLLRCANLSHQMLLALARVVCTKIVLRPDGHRSKEGQEDNKWDFLFHQSGMIGFAILFPNATCGEALQHFPPEKVDDTFAVSFLTNAANGKSSQPELTSHARQVVTRM